MTETEGKKGPGHHWNYRLMEHIGTGLLKGEPWVAIHEVYYDDNGKPTSYSMDPSVAYAETREGLIEVLKMMHRAFDRPTLSPEDFKR